MELIQSFIDFTQGLGAACMMPIFVFLIGLVVRVPFKEARRKILCKRFSTKSRISHYQCA